MEQYPPTIPLHQPPNMKTVKWLIFSIFLFQSSKFQFLVHIYFFDKNLQI